MQVSPHHSLSRGLVGFTLIELLVVITIVGILAAMILPVFSKVQDRARTIQAVNDMRNIKVSIISYYTDYQKYPVTDGQAYYADPALSGQHYDSDFGDPGGYYWSADLFDILRANANTRYNVSNELNPNKVVYWPGQFVKNAIVPKSGITTQDVKDGTDVIHKGDLVDPWGNPYVVWINVTRTGDLTQALGWFYQDYTTETDADAVKPGLPPFGGAWPWLGPDGEWGTKDNNILKGSDDIVTWTH